MQLKKYAVTLAVPVQVLVDAKDSQQAIHRASALVTQQGVVEAKPLVGYSNTPLESFVVDGGAVEPDEDEPMVA